MTEPTHAPDLDTLVEGVHDEQTFVAFVEALADDFAVELEMGIKNPELAFVYGWQNGSIDTFLARAAAWSHMTRKLDDPPIETNPWLRCAWILYAGKFYE